MRFPPASLLNLVLSLSVVAAFTIAPDLAQGTQAADGLMLPRDSRAEITPLLADIPALQGALPVEPGEGWRPLKLYGGIVTVIAVSPIDPNLVLAGNQSWVNAHGTFVSRDGGRTWERISLPLGQYDADIAADIEFSPDGTPYILTYRALWRGTRDATAWEALNDVAPESRFTYYHEIAFDPAHEGEIWVSTLKQIEGSTPSLGTKLARSTDNGVTWTEIVVPPTLGMSITGIAFNRSNTDRMVVTFSGGDSGRAIRSLDGGDHWTIGSGTPSNRPLQDVIHDGSRFYVCGGDGADGPGTYNTGVYASDNDGIQWIPQHTAAWPTRQIHDLDYDPSTGSVLAATGKGIFRLANGTWSFGIGRTLSKKFTVVKVVPGAPGRILAGDNLGVQRSEDDGGGFETSSDGILLLNVNVAISNPMNPLEIAASFASGEHGGVYTSTDGGNSWTLQSLPNMRFNALSFDRDGVLYAASPSRTVASPEGIYRRNPDGTWTHLGPRHGGTNYSYNLNSIHVSRDNPEIIFATGYEWRIGVPYASIWRSLDAGASWSQVFSHTQASGAMSVNELQVVNDGTGQNVLAAQTFGGGVLRSQDGGTTWNVVPGIPGAPACFSLRGTPADRHAFYLSNPISAVSPPGPCFSSRDGGVSWEPLHGQGSQSIARLEVDRLDANTLFGIQSAFPVVVRSTNGGDTFDPFDAGLENVVVNDIAWQNSPCPTLLLATRSGVFTRTIDAAAPQISVTLEPNVLWPPNHALRTIRARVNTTDGCDGNPSFALQSIAAEDGAAAGDIVAALGEGTTSFQLRATRPGKGDRRYVVTFRATDASGNVSETSAVVVVPHDRSGVALSGGDEPAARLPDRTEFVSISPNPFNPSTTVSVTVARGERATLDVYDVHGARVRQLSTDRLPAGMHRIAWDGTDDAGRSVASGVYFFRLAAGDRVQTRKALLVK